MTRISRGFGPESASGKASSGKVQLALIRAPAGPNPKQASTYTIELRGTSLGRSVSSGPAELAVPQALSGAFFASPVPAAAAATAAPTSTPTAAPQPTAATPTETVAASATAVSFSVPTTLTAQVSNSGNLREQPNLTGKVLGQIKSGETVTLLEKTADGGWFRLTAAAGTGWSSATLLAVPRETAAAVPGPGQTAAQPTASAAQPTAAAPAPFNGPPVSGQTAKVTQGGNVRTTASRDGAVLGLVDTNDTVQLRGRSANNAWMLGTTGKGLTGWINAALLQLPANVAQLPVTALTVTAQSAALPPTPNAVQPTAAPQATPKPTASAPQPTAAPQATPKPTAGTRAADRRSRPKRADRQSLQWRPYPQRTSGAGQPIQPGRHGQRQRDGHAAREDRRRQVVQDHRHAQRDRLGQRDASEHRSGGGREGAGRDVGPEPRNYLDRTAEPRNYLDRNRRTAEPRNR